MKLSQSERTVILRAASIFFETPTETLLKVADLLEQVEYKAGETIFRKGDHGDCMYFIVRGRVSVHDGELILNHLNPHDVFGEMAVLNAEPRVASVTTTEDTILLRLDQGPFYQLMAEHREISNGIIRLLSRYLVARVHDIKEDFAYIKQMERIIAAATALEAGIYDPTVLNEVVQRTDSLGQLARVFKRMAGEVHARELMLRDQIQKLRIEVDEARKCREVSEITESEYFQELQKRVHDFKGRARNK